MSIILRHEYYQSQEELYGHEYYQSQEVLYGQEYYQSQEVDTRGLVDMVQDCHGKVREFDSWPWQVWGHT